MISFKDPLVSAPMVETQDIYKIYLKYVHNTGFKCIQLRIFYEQWLGIDVKHFVFHKN